jgi:hypothetical protein
VARTSSTRSEEVDAMSHAAWIIRKSLLAIPVALAALLSAPAECRAGEEEPALVRIRSHSSVISKAIREGPARSENFRRLVAEVGGPMVWSTSKKGNAATASGRAFCCP